MISYDKFHAVPRTWLVGYDEDRQPLKPEQVRPECAAVHRGGMVGACTIRSKVPTGRCTWEGTHWMLQTTNLPTMSGTLEACSHACGVECAGHPVLCRSSRTSVRRTRGRQRRWSSSRTPVCAPWASTPASTPTPCAGWLSTPQMRAAAVSM
jgi:Autophagocytosis associated protein, active-site domain